MTGNWFDELSGQKFDLIVSNPPYVAEMTLTFNKVIYVLSHRLPCLLVTMVWRVLVILLTLRPSILLRMDGCCWNMAIIRPLSVNDCWRIQILVIFVPIQIWLA